MRKELTAAAVLIPLMEIDPAMRQNLLGSQEREFATAMAIHVYLRLRRHFRFCRYGVEASLKEVVEQIGDTIWTAPDQIITAFASADAADSAAASNYLAQEILRSISVIFETIKVSQDYG